MISTTYNSTSTILIFNVVVNHNHEHPLFKILFIRNLWAHFDLYRWDWNQERCSRVLVVCGHVSFSSQRDLYSARTHHHYLLQNYFPQTA